MDCNECNLCCKLPEISALNKKAWVLCEHWEPGKRCKIYGRHPESCKKFICAYQQMEKCSTDLRPDKCGMMFEKISDDIFAGTFDTGIFSASRVAKKQINSFLKQGFSIILFHHYIEFPLCLPTKGKTKEDIWKEFQRVRDKWECQNTQQI